MAAMLLLFSSCLLQQYICYCPVRISVFLFILPGERTGTGSIYLFRVSGTPEPPRLHGRATGTSILKPTRFYLFVFLLFARRNNWVDLFFGVCDTPDPPHLHDRGTGALFVQPHGGLYSSCCYVVTVCIK